MSQRDFILSAPCMRFKAQYANNEFLFVVRVTMQALRHLVFQNNTLVLFFFPEFLLPPLLDTEANLHLVLAIHHRVTENSGRRM